MPEMQPAKILRIHISESDRRQGKPLYEAIIAACRELQIAGATVFRGLEGYGENAELHKHPIVITVVDTAENIERLVPVVAGMMDTGLMASSQVQMVRVQRTRS
jgi:PII-like signaling protein